jgi:hypothetical protein
MQNHKAMGGLQAPEFSIVYSYLAVGILLLIATFVFLPRVTS